MKKGGEKSSTNKPWFPAKKYGYGWGLPRVWQGWVALSVCLAVGAAPFVYVAAFYKGDAYCNELIAKGYTPNCNPNVATPVYAVAAVLWLVAWILILVQISTKKGEKPSWRWGNKKEKKAHATKS